MIPEPYKFGRKPFFLKFATIPFKKGDLIGMDYHGDKVRVLRLYKYTKWKRLLNKILWYIWSEEIIFRDNEYKVKYL